MLSLLNKINLGTKMADYFEITGGKKLKGVIDVRGSKNATTPILAATLLTKEKCTISNIPLIEDVFVMLEILESLGAEIKWLGKRKISIQTKEISPDKINQELVKKMRSSILLIGALSARCDNFQIARPGGCVIGARSMDTHFEALRDMGITIEHSSKLYRINAKKRKTAEIVLNEFSVTATENAMMLAAGIQGKTIIKIAATEPHVEDLGNFLISMGVKIKGPGTHTLEIQGSKKLKGAKHEIIPDANEAATFLIMAVATKSPIKINNVKKEHLDLILKKLQDFGAKFIFGKNYIKIVPPEKIMAVEKVDTRTYPGIPTDVQAPFSVLATQANGQTLIHDSLYEGRFDHIGELQKMGAKAKVLDVHRVVVFGPTKLKGKTITSFNLRAGATLIIAALAAKGKTIIKDIYQVDRGYEKIEERLAELGADIRRIKN
jgi:UDP-N-acetylglucosamine 1-carboxyvinyltransferase